MKCLHSACADPRLIADTLPIIPPNAPIHPASGAGVAAGRGKIPGKKTPDGWVGMHAWTKHCATPEDLRIWAGWQAGFGLQGRNFPAIDIDVDDKELSDAIRSLVLDVMGNAPTRYGNGARCLLVYAASGMKKRRLTFARRSHLADAGVAGTPPPLQAVEFLAEGQQYVVEGIHPKTSKPYWWLNDQSPASMGAGALPNITTAHLDRLFAALPTLLDLHGFEVVTSTKAAKPSPAIIPVHNAAHRPVCRAPSIEAIRAALLSVENDLDYNDWITLSAAVKASAGPELEDKAFLIWADWSLTYPGSTIKVVNAKWASFKTPQADWRYLSNYAKLYGDGSFHDAHYEFDAVELAPPPHSGLKEAATDLPITAMLARYVWVESLALIVDTETGMLLNREKFNVRNRHIGAPNNKDKCAYSVLTSDVTRLQIASALTYRPGGDGFVDEDLPGLVGRCVNIWKPSRAVLPQGVTEADIQPWLDHMAFVIPNREERELVINWLAWIVQNPGEKPNWALVVGSTAEGIGKDLMLQPVRVALGTDNVREIGPDDIASGYTDYLVGTRLLIVEEMQMHERKAIMNRLKPMIAAPPYTLRVNIKYVPQYEVPNLVAAIFFTNMENALAIAPQDRRYFVTWNDQKPRTSEYYSGLAAWYANGGAAAAAAWLCERDVTEFNAKSAAPASAAKTAMRLATRSLFDEVLEDGIANKEGPFEHPFFTLDEAVSYVERKLGDRQRISPQRVAAALKKLGLRKVGRMALGAQPANCNTPYLNEAREHQVFGVFSDEDGLNSAAIRAAFWASRQDTGSERTADEMFR